MSCFVRILLLCAFLCDVALSAESPLALTGLPCYESSPARKSAPGIGLSFTSFINTEEYDFESSGELEFKNHRGAFLVDFHRLDSVYQRIYSELEWGYPFSRVIAGFGYGVSLEWIPGQTLWTRHRYKVGLSFEWNRMYIGGMASGWFDDMKRIDFLVGGGFSASGSFSMFYSWDGKNINVGTTVDVHGVSLASGFRFPGFGVALALDFSLSQWKFGCDYVFANERRDLFGVGLSKSLKKKTIL
ncbi:MAG: hypothetical protein MJZ25_09700 [Fibrobacter sp.]|nr:hypothetical protein [Fibrobacter sp.]